MLNGIDDLAVTNVDGLDTMEKIRVCVAYKLGRKKVDFPPSDIDLLALCEPVYEEFDGWQKDTTGAKRWGDLPPKCRKYLSAIAKLVGAKLGIVSVGPGREQTIIV
jgi:adenylosuccinate synthase